MSCQLVSRKPSFQKRAIASIFSNSGQKLSIAKTFELNPNSKWIYWPVSIGVSSITINDLEVKCKGTNLVRTEKENTQTFYISENSNLRCASENSKNVDVNYNFYSSKIKEISDIQLSSFQKILNENDNLLLKNELKKLDLYHLFGSDISLADLKMIDFKTGDFVEIEFSPQQIVEKCPNGECEVKTNIFGLSAFLDEKMFLGINQLKFPTLSPFIFFCGARFAAGKISFRSDESLKVERLVDSNGFSCDINNFLLSSSSPEIKVKLFHITKEIVEDVFLGKEENLIKLQDQIREVQIQKLTEDIFAVNELQSFITPEELDLNSEFGFVELWWEPFKNCSNLKDCSEYKYILTKLNIIYKNTKENRVIEVPNNFKSFVYSVEGSSDEQVSRVIRMCPSDLSNFLLEFKNFKSIKKISELLSEIESFENNSICSLKLNLDKGTSFSERSLYLVKPKTMDINETELIVEDFMDISRKKQNLKLPSTLDQYRRPRLIQTLTH